MLMKFIRDDGKRFELSLKSRFTLGKDFEPFPAKPLRSSIFEYAANDGGEMVSQNYGIMPIDIAGNIVPKDHSSATFYRMEAEMLAFFAKGHHFTTVIELKTGAQLANSRSFVSATPEIKVHQNEASGSYSLQVTLELPYFYEYAEDDEGNAIYANELQISRAVAAAGGYVISSKGYEIAGGLGYKITGGGISIVSSNISSIIPVSPLWEISGPSLNPSLVNFTTNQTLTYNGFVAAGQTLIIDNKAKTAELNGANVFDDLSGDWVWLIDGENRVGFNSDNLDDVNTSILRWNNVVR